MVAAWIAACEARGKTLPEGHFTDPLDAALAALLASSCRRNETVAAVFDLAGFARDHAERQTLIELVAAHLVHLRQGGPALALRRARHTERTILSYDLMLVTLGSVPQH